MSTTPVEHPEHAKMRAVRDKSQEIGRFLEWLQANGMSVAVLHKHTDRCRFPDGTWLCRYEEGEYTPSFASIESLLARYFEIDLNVIETEKQHMLQVLREAQEKDSKP